MLFRSALPGLHGRAVGAARLRVAPPGTIVCQVRYVRQQLNLTAVMTHRPAFEAKPRAGAQPGLFDADPQAATTGATAAAKDALVAIQTPAAAQTKAQRAFNRLIGQIRAQRELLAQWQAYTPRHNQRLASELQPLQVQVRAARRAVLELLDQLLDGEVVGPPLSKAQRRKLQAVLPPLARLLLEDGPDAEIEALFDKHSDVSHADLRQAELADAESVFGKMLGDDLMQGHQAQSLEEMMRHAAQQLAAQAEQQSAQQARDARQAQAQAQARSQASGKASRVDAARQQKEDAALQASESVREIFRKLASALHPDREPDAALRQRKTQLMQQANQAYAQNDLLTLLSMQLDLEQIDEQHLAGLPDARLLHYNQVLREQLAALQQEVADQALPYRMMLTMTIWQRQPGPSAVDLALTQDIVGLQRCLADIERNTAQLGDPSTRKAAIGRIVQGDPDDEPDPFEMMLMMEAMADLVGAPVRPKRPARPNRR